jgi:hypothetical protein
MMGTRNRSLSATAHQIQIPRVHRELGGQVDSRTTKVGSIITVSGNVSSLRILSTRMAAAVKPILSNG